MDGNLAMANSIVFQNEHDFEPEEIWNDITGYEGLYQINYWGEIKSLIFWRGSSERILSDRFNKKGYKTVILYKDGIGKSFSIHQLMAIEYLNHKPSKMKLVVDHIDNIKTNNFISNIQIITNRLNISKDVKNKSSKYTGVSFDKKNKKWRSSITINKKQINLGRFNTEIEAYNAYLNKLNDN